MPLNFLTLAYKSYDIFFIILFQIHNTIYFLHNTINKTGSRTPINLENDMKGITFSVRKKKSITMLSKSYYRGSDRERVKKGHPFALRSVKCYKNGRLFFKRISNTNRLCLAVFYGWMEIVSFSFCFGFYGTMLLNRYWSLF